MNRLTKKLASVMLVSAMVLTQPGMTFASVRNVTVEPVDVEVAAETIDIDDAIVNEAAPENESEEIVAEETDAETETISNVSMESEEIVVFDEETFEDDDSENVDSEKFSDGSLTPYYPTRVTIMSAGKENPSIILCKDNDNTDDITDTAELELNFYGYGEESEEEWEKMTHPSKIIWEPSNSRIINVDPEGEPEEAPKKATITIKEDDETGRIYTGTQIVFAKLIYESPFEKKEIKTVSIKVSVVKANRISSVAITENEKIVSKVELVYDGNDGEDTKKLSTIVKSPNAYVGFEYAEWTTASPYIMVSGDESEATLELDTYNCKDLFSNTKKKSINARATFTGYYYREDGAVAKKVVSNLTVTIKKADVEPVLEKNSFTINKFSVVSDDVDYSADSFRIVTKYGRAVSGEIEVYSTQNKALPEFKVVANGETEDPYDYYIYLDDAYREDYKISKNIAAKLVVPYGDTNAIKAFNIKIKVLVEEPKITLTQRGSIELFNVDKIKGDYAVKVSNGEIESIQAVFTDKYNQIVWDDRREDIKIPSEEEPSYIAEYPALKKLDKEGTPVFEDYSTVFLYPYEHADDNYTNKLGTPDEKKEDVYNINGYTQIKGEIDNFQAIKNIKLLVTMKGKFGEIGGDPIEIKDTTNPEWKYKYRVVNLPIKTTLKVPTGKTYDYECTPDMIEEHILPDGGSTKKEYVLNSRAIAYGDSGVYEPETATYVTNNDFLKYPEGESELKCIKDEVTKVTQIPIIWNFGGISTGVSSAIVLRLSSRHWSKPLDVKHNLKVLPNTLPKTKFSTSKVTVRNDGSDIAAITIAGPNGVNLDGFTTPHGMYEDYTTDDISENDKPITFFNPYNSDEINKVKNDKFNSKVYIRANTIDPRTGKVRALKPGTYRYVFAGYVINEQGDTDDSNNDIAYSEVNTIDVVVIDAKTKKASYSVTSAGNINTVCRYDDEDYMMRKGSSIKLKPVFTNTARAYMNDPADAIIKKVKWYGKTVSGNYINEELNYLAPEPDPSSKLITKDAYDDYEKNIIPEDGTVSQYPFFAHYDRDTQKIILEANKGFPLRTDCTYTVTLGLCSRDQYCRVTNEYKDEETGKDEEGYIYCDDAEFLEKNPWATFDSDYREYTFSFKVKEEIPVLKLNKNKITLYASTPDFADKVELYDTTNVVHKYIRDVKVDSVTGPSLSKNLSKEYTSGFFNVVFKKATMFYISTASEQKEPEIFKNIITIKPDDDKVNQLLPGTYTVKLNVICEDMAANTMDKQVTISVNLK